MATERFEAFAGAARPAGLVNVIVPDGRAAGAKVAGVTWDGETTCPLARPGARANAAAIRAKADRLRRTGRSMVRRVIRQLLSCKASPAWNVSRT